ncbi:MAG: hypothetical protein HYR55_16250 [Acidobacteria bacterium]|nr:hypothetical protein [Acidobacteriota bacterium]MBI3655477.1 hypothetical protein [Acidobacteriota bacterium]
MGRRDREEKMLRQLRTEGERKAVARLSEIAESGGSLTTTTDLEDAITALRVLGKKFEPAFLIEDLEDEGWITQVEGRSFLKRPIPLFIFGQFVDKAK